MSCRLLITGGRGRLARVIADWHGSEGKGGVRLFSRQSGDGMEKIDRLFDPGVLSEGDVLLHTAWSSIPATAEWQPGISERHDLPLLRRLLLALQAVSPEQRPHLIFFSSGGAVYGNAPGRPSVELDDCRPISAYGRAKRVAEEIIENWSREQGALCTILRISNPYGFSVPRERPQGIISHAIRATRDALPLPIWGDGTARKDFIHCTDFLRGLAKVMVKRPVGIFNLSRGESHTLNEVLAEVELQTGRPIVRAPSQAVGWDVHDSRLANDQLCRALDWSPMVGLAEGIRLSIAAIDQHADRV